MNSKRETVINFNICGALFLVLLVLKLSGTIDWSWWIVLLPIYLPLIVLGAVIGILFIAGGLTLLICGISGEEK